MEELETKRDRSKDAGKGISATKPGGEQKACKYQITIHTAATAGSLLFKAFASCGDSGLFLLSKFKARVHVHPDLLTPSSTYRPNSLRLFVFSELTSQFQMKLHGNTTQTSKPRVKQGVLFYIRGSVGRVTSKIVHFVRGIHERLRWVLRLQVLF